MVAVDLSEAKEILEKYQTKRGKVTSVNQSAKCVDAIFLSQTDSKDLEKALHLRYDEKDLVVQKAELVDKQTKVTDIAGSWERDLLLLKDYKGIRRALGLQE